MTPGSDQDHPGGTGASVPAAGAGAPTSISTSPSGSCSDSPSRSDSEDAAAELDLRGQRCPAPIIALGRALRSGRTGIVVLLADDPAAAHDVPAWCEMSRAELVSAEPVPAGWTRYTVQLPAP